MQFYFLVVSPRNRERGAGKKYTSCPPCPLVSPCPPSPGNSKNPEQLSIMFPTQPSELSILDKLIQPHIGRMLHGNNIKKSPG
ncbi:MAG: hypothetical protein V7K89_20980 [Nostoc sp.]